MRVRQLIVVAACALLCACGGGGGSSPGGVVPNPGPSPVKPTPTPSSMPVTESVSVKAAPQATAVPLPPLAGYGVTVNLPAISGSGTLTITVSTQPLAGTTALTQMTAENGAAGAPTASATPLLYLSIVSNSTITLADAPRLSVTVPSSLDINGRTFYFPRYLYQQWNASPAYYQNSAFVTPPSITPTPRTLSPGLPFNYAMAYCEIDDIILQLPHPLVIGTPADVTFSFWAEDGLGYYYSGPLSHPINFSMADPSGRTTLQTAAITDTSQPVKISYSGKGDKFTITAQYESVSSPATFITNLPAGVTLAATNATPYDPAMDRFLEAPDGNFWTPYVGGLARVTPTGQFTYFADPNAVNGRTSWIAQGSDGNLWTFYGGAGTSGFGTGIDRVTTSGQFTSFPFNSTVTGGNGPLVRGTDGALYFPGGNGVARIDTAGNMTLFASLPAVSYLTLGADGSLWASNTTAIYKISQTGQVTTYAAPPIANPNNQPLYFMAGYDGQFWAPYAYLNPVLLKFNTQGSIVSTAPLAYAPVTAYVPPYPQLSAPYYLSDMVEDRAGNIYLSDPYVQGVIRITPGGAYSEYPVAQGAQSDPIHLALRSDGKLEISSAVNPPAGGFQLDAIAAFDPSLW